MKTKICSKCNQEKEITCFGKDKNRKDGFSFYCKDCKKEEFKLYYNHNKQKINEKHKEYYNQNKENAKVRSEKWRSENLDYMKRWRSEHPKPRKSKKEKKPTKTKEERKRHHNEYKKEKYRKDYSYRLQQNTARRIRQSLKKDKGTVEYLGCDIEFYKQYLEEKFKEGMSWDNYGEWEIDHIKPVISFNLEKNEEIFECFNYKNTQPIWKYENRSKGKIWHNLSKDKKDEIKEEE